MQKEVSQRLSNLRDKIAASVSIFEIVCRTRWKIKDKEREGERETKMKYNETNDIVWYFSSLSDDR